MRQLILARHAKSSWGDPALRDHDRPLNARGRRAADRVGARLRELGCVPDRVCSSSSLRTRETWAGMRRHFGDGPQASFHRELYLASPRTVLDRIAAAPAAARVVMVLGHNPTTHALAAHLSREGDPAALARLRIKFPTGAAAIVDLYGDRWEEAGEGGALRHFVLPRELSRRIS